jgi:hypothetical protein
MPNDDPVSPEARENLLDARVADILSEFEADREATSEKDAVLHLARALAWTEQHSRVTPAGPEEPREDVRKPRTEGIDAHAAGMVCVSNVCSRHPGHPAMGHCESCIDDSDEGYGTGLFTFRDAEPKCCCRDVREPR